MENDHKEIKKILEGQRKEYQRYLGVALESVEDQIKIVAESLEGTQEQLVAIREMVSKNTEDIQSLATDMHIVRSDLKEKVGRDEFTSLEKRLSRLERMARA